MLPRAATLLSASSPFFRTRVLLSSWSDYGLPSGAASATPYRPRFRPRRLVMPIDLDSLAESMKTSDPLKAAVQDQRRLARETSRRGAATLGAVAGEKSVADLVTIALQQCRKMGYLDATTPSEDRASSAESATGPNYSAAAVLSDQGAPSAPPATSNGDADVDAQLLDAVIGTGSAAMGPLPPSLLPPRAARPSDEAMIELLRATPLNAPLHGHLSLQGRALVEHCLCADALSAYPRLRSFHVNRLRGAVVGLFHTCRVAERLGLPELLNISTDVGVWREMSKIEERRDLAARNCVIHSRRLAAAGDDPGSVRRDHHRAWWWRKELRRLSSGLTRLPGTRETIQPRIEWLRDLIFTIVAVVCRSEGNATAKALIRQLFYKNFHDACLAAVATQSKLGGGGSTGHHLNLTKKGIARDALTPEDEPDHPLNVHALDVAAASRASSYMLSTEQLVDPVAEANLLVTGNVFGNAIESLAGTPQHQLAIPLLLQKAMDVDNPMMEVQILLRYGPDVLSPLRGSAIDFDAEYVDNPVMATNRNDRLNYGSAASIDSPKVVRVSLVAVAPGEGASARRESLAGDVSHANHDPSADSEAATAKRASRTYKLAEAVGEDEATAMQHASQMAVTGYYSRTCSV